METGVELRITRNDIEPHLKNHQGNKMFSVALEKTDPAHPAELLWVLGTYVHFNSVFAPGVANLAGEVGIRQDLFRDAGQPVSIIADRSAEVAAKIFFAAIDEYAGRTHRSIAQKTLTALTGYFEVGPAQLNGLLQPSEQLLRILRDVADGYGLNQNVNEETLLHGIGFHMGSEILADGEFMVLHDFLARRHAPLVSYLKSEKAYHWIEVHTTVEADHFEAAVVAANLALKHYQGVNDLNTVKEQIMMGFEAFAGVQVRFMNHLLSFYI